MAIREIFKRILESSGYNVVLFEDGHDVLDFFREEIKTNREISAMIFDLTIAGGMGGEEAVKEIRKLCTKTPVFVASGYSQSPIIADPAKYGFTASICKPFIMSELAAMLEKHMSKS